MSNFESIGFKIEKKEDITQLFLNLKDKSKKEKYGSYYQYTSTDKSGAQLYWYSRKQNIFAKEEFIGVTPSFSGSTIQQAREISIIPNEKWPLEPLLSCWVFNDEGEEYPLIVDIPNYLEIKEEKLGEIKKINATLFPKQFEHFKNEEEFFKKYPKKEKISMPAPGMFIPTGTFDASDNPDFKQKSECWCYGKIDESKKLSNEFTNMQFYHFVMETYGGIYDVVVPSSQVTVEPEPGDIVGGFFWISAKLVYN